MKKFKELRLLFSFLKEIKKEVIFALFISFIAVVINFSVSAITIFLVVLVLESKVSFLTLFMIALVLTIILDALFKYIDVYKFHHVAYLLIYKFRIKLYEAIERNAPLITRKNRTGQLNSIIMEDTEVLELFYAHTVNVYIVSFIFTVVVIIATCFFDWVFASIILVSSILLLIIPFTLFNWGHKLDNSIREQIGTTNAEAIDTIQGLREILSFNREEFFINKMKRDTIKLNKVERKNGFRTGLQGAMIGLVMSFATIVSIYYGYTQILANQMTPSMLLIVIFLLPQSLVPMMKLASMGIEFTGVVASAKRIHGLLVLAPNVEYSNKEDSTLELSPSIEFKDVDFSYKKEQPVLNSLSFSVKEGETIALMGESGAGKTTIASLLIRFYDCNKGEVLIGGKNIKELSEKELRDTISYAPQDLYLFNCSIKENIRFAKINATDEEIEQAAKIANAHEFITALPEAYDTVIGERGLKLSGGEKQRISIARAILKDSPILILDEAVSNLDSKSEELFMQSLKQLEKKTIIIIAHRESTVKNADRILNLENGKIL